MTILPARPWVAFESSAEDRHIGLLTVPTPCEDTTLLAALERYERNAAHYSLQVLHDAGISDLDQWFSDYAECDVQYLLSYYRTGVKRDPLSFWVDGTTLVAPMPIPACTFSRWVDFRNGGVVI